MVCLPGPRVKAATSLVGQDERVKGMPRGFQHLGLWQQINFFKGLKDFLRPSGRLGQVLVWCEKLEGKWIKQTNKIEPSKT